MKNLKKISLFALAILLIASNSAFALVCAPSRNAQGSADDCWTSVQVASNETTLVSQGTVLVLDITNAQFDPDNSAYQARVSTSGTSAYVVGIAQQSITSGSTALVLVRGKGKVKVQGAVTSGNPLFVSSTAGRLNNGDDEYKPQAVALSNGTTTEVDAYVTIV